MLPEENINAMRPLGQQMKYFVGNGRVGMGTREENCEIDFLIGPSYTSPDFVKSSKLEIITNSDILTAQDFETMRLIDSNCFVSSFSNLSYQIRIFDFSLWGTNETIRLFNIINKTDQKLTFTINFELQTDLKINSNDENVSVLSEKDKDTFFCWTKMYITDWLSRKMEAYFTGDYSFLANENKIIYSSEINIEPGSDSECALVFGFAETVDEEIKRIDVNTVKKQFIKNMGNWKNWCKKLQIADIPESMEKDIIISNLIMIKSCQSFDGGFMACPFQYCFSYFRDSHGGLRGLYKAGCHKELKEFLLWAHNIYSQTGDNFNSCAMGSIIFQNLESSEENLASESPSLFCITAKYYFDLTNDMELIRLILPSLETAIMSQIKYIDQNEGNLRFNGDETERYVPRNDGDMYHFTSDFSHDDFTCSAMVLFIAAAKFYMEINPDSLVEAAIEKVENTILHKHLDKNRILKWQTGLEDRNYLITNYNLFPIWMDVELPENITEINALEMLKYFNLETGYLPISPGVTEGFTGHTLGIALDAYTKLNNPKQHEIMKKLTGLTDRFGTFSEFYGPGGVSNTHNMNIFSSGINVAAMIDYIRKNGR